MATEPPLDQATAELLATDPRLDPAEAAAAITKAAADHPQILDCIAPMAYAHGAAGQALSLIRRGDPAAAAHLALSAQAILALGWVLSRQAVTA